MSRLCRVLVGLTAVLCAASPPTPACGQGALYFVPFGEDPNDFGDGPTIIDARDRGGAQFDFEVYIKALTTPLRSVALDIACAQDRESEGSIDYVRGSGVSNSFRPDHIFFQQARIPADGQTQSQCPVDHSTCLPAPQPSGLVRFACARNSGDTDISDGVPRYCFEFSLIVSSDACGVFTIPMIGGSGATDIHSGRIPMALQDLIILTRDASNDLYSAALPVGDGEIAFDTGCATTDGPAGCPTGADIWYAWTAGCTGTLVVEAPGARIGIYGPGLVEPPTDADEVVCDVGRSDTVAVQRGEAYVIRVGAPDDGRVAGTLSIRTEPVERYADFVGANGACGPDGVVNLNEVLAVWDGFNGRFPSGCGVEELDIARVRTPGMAPQAGCEPDGRIDLVDVLAVLDAFQGIDRCCGPP